MTYCTSGSEKSYPEGAMLAVLLLNCFAPLIDWCVVNANINRRMRRAIVKNQ